MVHSIGVSLSDCHNLQSLEISVKVFEGGGGIVFMNSAERGGPGSR